MQASISTQLYARKLFSKTTLDVEATYTSMSAAMDMAHGYSKESRVGYLLPLHRVVIGLQYLPRRLPVLDMQCAKDCIHGSKGYYARIEQILNMPRISLSWSCWKTMGGTTMILTCEIVVRAHRKRRGAKMSLFCWVGRDIRTTTGKIHR
jgi:hypothetical protein